MASINCTNARMENKRGSDVWVHKRGLWRFYFMLLFRRTPPWAFRRMTQAQVRHITPIDALVHPAAKAIDTAVTLA